MTYEEMKNNNINLAASLEAYIEHLSSVPIMDPAQLTLNWLDAFKSEDVQLGAKLYFEFIIMIANIKTDITLKLSNEIRKEYSEKYIKIVKSVKEILENKQIKFNYFEDNEKTRKYSEKILDALPKTIKAKAYIIDEYLDQPSPLKEFYKLEDQSFKDFAEIYSIFFGTDKK